MRAPFLAFALLAAAMAGTCQQSWLLDRLHEGDGLPGQEFYALLEDRNGMVWIGTEAGLARMEGTRIRVWQHDPKDSTSLSSQQVNAIAEDAEGTIWVATAHGFQRYLPGTNSFERHHVPKDGAMDNVSNRIYDLAPDDHGSVWLVTDDGLYRFRTATGAVEPVPASDDPRKGPFSIRTTGSNSLRYDQRNGGLWCSTRDGLCFLDIAHGEWYGPHHDPKGWGCFGPGGASCTASDTSTGIWWFNTDPFALVHTNLRTGRSTRYPTVNGERIHFSPQWMHTTRDGSVWMGTWTYRCLRFDPSDSSWTELRAREDGTDPERLRSSNVKSFLEDRHGNLWFGTYAGLDLARTGRQLLALQADAVPTDAGAVTAMAMAGRDSLVLATLKGALFIRDGDGILHPARFPASGGPASIQGLARRDAHRLWVAAYPGPWSLDLRTGACAPWEEAPPALKQASVQDIRADAHGDVWACTWKDGLFVKRESGTPFEVFHDTLPGDHQLPWRGGLCLLTRPDGDVLLGLNNSGGLCRFVQGRPPLRRYLAEEAGSTSSSGVVLCLAPAADGGTWAGTHTGGAVHLDLASGQARQYTHADGLPSNRVNSLLTDAHGGLWALTDRGLARLPQGASVFLPVPLPAGMNARRISSGLVPFADGRIGFALGTTLVSFHPDRFMREHGVPGTRIMRIATADTTLWAPADRPITLPPGQHGLTIEWGTDDPLDGPRAAFAYRVAPDTAWIPVGRTGRIDLNGLVPGEHRVEVHATLDGMNWGPAAATPLIRVLPPLQDTWWFRVGMALVLLAIAWLAVRLYVQRSLAAQRTAFERGQAVLAERMRIAGDMHDDLGAGLSALKLSSEMALRTEQDPAKQDQLRSLAYTAGELIGSMRHIIWSMNADQGSVEDLVVYVTNHARSYLDGHGLPLELHAPGPWPEVHLSSEQRRNLFLVVKEALHNIVKHANASRVRIAIDAGDGRLRVRIADDGIGLGPQATEGMGNGLRNMRKRVDALGGELAIDGHAGTTIALGIPLPDANKSSIGALGKRGRPLHP